MKKKIVSVYGYGRFGKLWSEILADDFHVKVFSRRGLKREEVREDIEITTEEDIFNCDAMFFCVSISSFEDLLIQSKKYFKKDIVYFDTCSVKVLPVKWMLKHIPELSSIITTHPMFGPDSYRSTDEKSPMMMSNVRSDDKVFNYWKEYFSSKHIRVEIMTPDEHDEMTAYSQGITHYIGRVIDDLKLKSGRIDTLGYSKLLEIVQQTCNDNWQLFLDLQKYNPYTSKMRDKLQESLTKISNIFNNKNI